MIAIGGPAGTKFGGNGESSACFRARLGFRGKNLNRTRDPSGGGSIRYTVCMATTLRVTLDQFLAVPESKPYRELMDGEICEKPMPNAAHSLLVSRLIYLLMVYKDRNDTFHVMPELRHADIEHAWVFLPDISVILKARLPGPASAHGNPVEIMPDLAIEVLSPEDRPGRIARKITYYRRAGVSLLWIVDPETETITVWERGGEPFEAAPDAPLAASPILPEFALDVAALFAVLHAA